jgi:hypothetical protein
VAAKHQDNVDDAVLNIHSTDDTEGRKTRSKASANKAGNKRDLDDGPDDESDGDMDVDEGIAEMGGFVGNSIGLSSGHNHAVGGGPSRGTKRNRGRG